jgi:orotate phosphoribosyltransferase
MEESEQGYLHNLLIQRGTFKSLEHPTLGTSGKVLVYYNNTDKLLGDNAFLEEFKKDPVGMVNETLKRLETDTDLAKLIKEIIVPKVKSILEEGKNYAISGGLRKDVPFAGAVAHELNLPYIGIFKPENFQFGGYLLKEPGKEAVLNPDLSEYTVIHIADLITEGSSVYEKQEDGTALGWIPALQKANAKVQELFSVVDRLEGGKENITGNTGVPVSVIVEINESFLEKASENKERDMAWSKDQEGWNKEYLRQNGALALLDAIQKDHRGVKFLRRYKDILKENSAWEELEKALQEEGFIKGKLDELL